MVRKRKEHRLLYEMICASDLVFEVTDSRFPDLTRSKKAEIYAEKRNKKLVIIMNKADLIPKPVAYDWKNTLNDEYETIFVSAQDHKGTSIIRKIIKREAQWSKIKVCFVGIPNTGKSSLINALKGKRSAPTSHKAGFTRGIHEIRLSSKVRLIDSPGLAPVDEMPEFELVLSGAINPEEVVAPEVVAINLIKKLVTEFPESLNEYTKGKVEYKSDPREFLETYSLYRFSKVKVMEVSRIILRDLQKGKIRYYHKPEK